MDFSKVLQVKLTLILFLGSTGLRAADISYNLRSTARSSDNILTSDVPQSGNSLSLGLGFETTENDLADFRYSLVGDFSVEKFYSVDVNSQQYKYFSARAIYAPKNTDFSLEILDELSQVPDDQFSGQTINNLREVNVLTVRPRYGVKVDATNEITLSGAYTKTGNDALRTIQGTNVDASFVEKGGALEWTRQLNSTQYMSLHFDSSDNQSEATATEGGIDYRRSTAYLSWVTRGRATQIDVSLGAQRIKDEFFRTNQTPFQTLEIDRKISLDKNLRFYYRKGYEEEIETFVSEQFSQVDSSAIYSLSARKSQEAGLSYRQTRDLSELRLDLTVEELENVYDSNTESRKSFGVNWRVPLEKIFRSRSRQYLDLYGSLSKTEYGNNTSSFGTNKNISYGVSYAYLMNTQFSLVASLNKTEYEDNVIIFSNNQADSLSFLISFEYRYVELKRRQKR